jgi:hypothetical protein
MKLFGKLVSARKLNNGRISIPREQESRELFLRECVALGYGRRATLA